MKSRNGVDTSFADLKNYLAEYSLEAIFPNVEVEELLKRLHKSIYPLLCWQIELNSSEVPQRIWLNECVSDLIQCIPLLAQGFYKACKVLHRSSIEEYLRFIVSDSGIAITDINTVYQLFDTSKEILTERFGDLIGKKINALHSTYGSLCMYVHSSSDSYCELSQALREYPRTEMSSVTTSILELVNTVHLMSLCLLILKPEVFSTMYYSNRDAILDNLSPSEKRNILP